MYFFAHNFSVAGFRISNFNRTGFEHRDFQWSLVVENIGLKR